MNLTNFINAIRYALDLSGYSIIFLKVKQIHILEALYREKDVVAVLPTGYGKSIIFHILPFLFEYRERNFMNSSRTNAIIVVAPLNSLIDDQISHLRKRGIKAAILCQRDVKSGGHSSTLSSSSESDTNSEGDEQPKHFHQSDLQDSNDKCRILFAHPEKVVSRNRLLESYQGQIVACVIDEAHLIEEWGHEFRPDYSKLCRLASLFPSAPILALTATAPKRTRDLLVENLHMKSPVIVIGNLNRDNIFLHKSKRKPAKTGSIAFEELLSPIANDLKKQLISYPLTIIYLPLKWCGFAFNYFVDILGEKSYFPTTSAGDPKHCLFAQYHSPQTDAMKTMTLEQLTDPKYKNKTIRVIFATVAIGLGVNIPNVRQIIHMTVPRTLESYYQQIGRAGRDGYPAKAYLYYNGTDISVNKPGLTDEIREYCLLSGVCMRKYIMNFFDADSPCGLSKHECCSNCASFCECFECLTESRRSFMESPESPAQTLVRTQRTLIRQVSAVERAEIKERLKTYRLSLYDNIFGSIDVRTGFTLALIDNIVANCDYLGNQEDVLESYPVWDASHAKMIINIINDVCTN